MAIQQWTIIKLVGPAAVDAAERHARWWAVRRHDDPSCFSPDDWTAGVRRSVAAYLARLAEHRFEMPIAYFSRHVDLWSTVGQLPYHLCDATAHVLHDGGELWCYPLPDRGRLVRRNTSAVRSAQFPEVAWLAGRLIEAAKAYQRLWPQATILINRQPITASSTNEAMQAAADEPPK